MATTTPQAAATSLTCFRHADRRTGVRCNRCDKPICPACMRESPVGFHCPDCAAPGVRGGRGRAVALMAAGALLLGITGVIALGALSDHPANNLPRAALSVSEREPGLPLDFRHNPNPPLPHMFPLYQGAAFLGFRSANTIAGVSGVWLYVVPDAQCEAVLKYYSTTLAAQGYTVTNAGTALGFTRAASTYRGAVQCPFPTPPDASGAALSGPWLLLALPPGQ